MDINFKHVSAIQGLFETELAAADSIHAVRSIVNRGCDALTTAFALYPDREAVLSEILRRYGWQSDVSTR